MTTRFGPLLQEELVPVLSRFLTAAGENAETGTQAAKLVLPAVLAGVLKSTAGNPDYAAALYRQAGAESGLSADEVQAQSERLIDLGNSLLPAVFDGNAADAAAELARQSGIAKASAARLLAMALPLVLAHLGRSSGSLPDFLKLLAGQSDHLAENLNGGLLSALGISNVAAVSAVAHKLSDHAASLQLSDDGLPAVSGKSSIVGSLPVLLLAAVLAVVAFKGCSTKVVEQGQDRPFEADVIQPHPAADQPLSAQPLPDEAVTTPNGPVAESASTISGQ